MVDKVKIYTKCEQTLIDYGEFIHPEFITDIPDVLVIKDAVTSSGVILESS